MVLSVGVVGTIETISTARTIVTTSDDAERKLDTSTYRRTAATLGVQPGGGDILLDEGVTLQDRYSILGVLGVGGMGSVYRARDLRFPGVTKLVAVKEMINIAADAGLREMIVRNFEREANLLATLSHPAIPRIFDYFTQENRSYLVQEFINGKDLEALLEESDGFLDEILVVSWAVQLCDVLTFLHNVQPQPIVFRDMKPSNVMIDNHGHVRLIDFGIARGFQVNQRGTMIGTEGYSPPEQYRGEYGPASDIYALGATLHHLLTRQDPRLEPPFSFADRPIRSANPAVRPELEPVIMKSLAYDHQDRYASAAAFKDALMKMAKETGILGRLNTGEGRPGDAARGTPSVKPLWSFACEDEIRGTPLAAQGALYIGSYDNNLYALNAADGKFRWKYATDGGLPGRPAFYNDLLYVGSEDSRLHAISARTGRVAWTYYADRPFRSSPCLAEGHIFIGSDDGYLHAINAQTGRRAWRTEVNGPVRSTPCVAEERVFFGCESGDFYCLDFTGVLKWRFGAKRAITSSPSVAKGAVYFGSVDWTVYALESSSGFAVWRRRLSKAVISSPALSNGVIYIGCADEFIYAFEARTSKEVWRFQTGGQANASPLVFEDALYCGSVDGSLYSLDLATGKVRWRFQTGGPITGAPAAADGRVFVGSNDRRVYAFAP